MRARIETITPDRAEHYLSMNTRNRPVSARRVKKIADAMQNGQWQENGDAIRISRSGVLLDGQHRLLAAKESGASFDSIVVEGLEDESFITIDTGKQRLASDILSIEGHKNCNRLAAIARLFLVWKSNGGLYSSAYRPTHEEVLDAANTYTFLQDATLASSSKTFGAKHLRGAYGGLAFAIIADGDLQRAHQFFDILCDPEQNGSKVVRLLQNRLMEDSGSKTRLSNDEFLALTLKAFRLWNAGMETKLLKVRTSGEKKEKDIFIAWPSQKTFGEVS
jgi:hypothetical protein